MIIIVVFTACIFILAAVLTMYHIGCDTKELEILNKLSGAMSEDIEKKRISGTSEFEKGYFQGRDDALDDVLDALGCREVSEDE